MISFFRIKYLRTMWSIANPQIGSQVGADPVRAVDDRLLQRDLYGVAALRHRALRQAVLTRNHAQGESRHRQTC